MMNIGIWCTTLASHKGGAERVSVRLAKKLVEAGHEATVFYIAYPGCTPKYPIPPEVHSCPMHTTSYSQNMDKLFQHLDNFIYFFGNDFFSLPLFACKKFKLLLIVTERTNVQQIKSNDRLSFLSKSRLPTIAVADRFIVLCEAYKYYNQDFIQKKTRVIPNYHTAPYGLSWERNHNTDKTIILCSRFDEEQKRISFLIKAFGKLASKFPDWNVKIYGSGWDRDNYKQLIANLGLESRIFLEGVIEDIYSAYKNAHIFCLPSVYEGMSNAMLEALASGLPYVGFLSLPGVTEVIQDGYNGLLAPEQSVDSLAAILEKLMGNENLRIKLAKSAMESSKYFTEERIFKKWEHLVQETAHLKGKNRLSQPPENAEEADARKDLENILNGKAQREFLEVNAKATIPIIRKHFQNRSGKS